MAILVVGSVAFDAMETPSGRRDRCLGGAATHFSLAASYFTDVRVIGVVGEDFGPEEENVLTRRNIDTRGIEHVPGKSFFWRGSYMKNLNEAQTLNTELNVFQSFSPKIPPEYQDSEYLFLANIDPVLQEDVRRKMLKVKMVCGDTMNYWIKDHAENLARVLKGLDVLLINDTEVKMLAKENNLCPPRVRSSTWAPRRSSSSTANTARRRSSATAPSPAETPSPSRSAHPPCLWPKSSTPPGREIPSPADSSATSLRSPRSRPPSSAAPCSTAA